MDVTFVDMESVFRPGSVATFDEPYFVHRVREIFYGNPLTAAATSSESGTVDVTSLADDNGAVNVDWTFSVATEIAVSMTQIMVTEITESPYAFVANANQGEVHRIEYRHGKHTDKTDDTLYIVIGALGGTVLILAALSVYFITQKPAKVYTPRKYSRVPTRLRLTF